MNTHTCEVFPHRWDVAEELAEGLGLPLVVGIVLARRGFRDVAQARAFLDMDSRVPDPFLFGGMTDAVCLLEEAVRAGRNIVIHGDYDVDGIAAACLLAEGLTRLGGDVETYLPNRFEQGYGLSEEAVRSIAEAGTDVLVTVDCGVSYPDEVALAMDLGLDVVVTDHHRPSARLPECPVVHPEVGEYPDSNLCGTGVAFKLLQGLYVQLEGARPDEVPAELRSGLDLVALATVADLVPLLGENRYYVSEGLREIAIGRRPGIRALLEVSGSFGSVDTGTLAFRLAPRLNAAGRLTDPEAPLRLLRTEDEAEAARLAEELDTLNRQRRDAERSVFEQALAQVDEQAALPSALVLSGEGWHEGVVGIVASRIVERFHRPAVVLALKDGVAKGSGRSIEGYDLMQGLEACADLLSDYGGHEQAAGMTLPWDSVESLRGRLREHAENALTEEHLRPRYVADAVVKGEELTLETVDALSRLAPFGMGNPAVRLLAVGAGLDHIRTTRGGEHLQCEVVVDGVRSRAIGFRLADKIPDLNAAESMHVGLQLRAGEWQGSTRAEVHLHSFYRPPDYGVHALGCSPSCPQRDPLELALSGRCCTESKPQSHDPIFLPGRDLRDGGGRLSAIAQVLSTGEPTVILGASVPERLRVVAGKLPLRELGVSGIDCVSRHCRRTKLEVREEGALFLDWETATCRPLLFEGRRHAVAVDPPYLPEHRRLLAELHAEGVKIHLCWGPEEREFTRSMLKALVHPKLWVTELYRARRSGLEDAEARAAAVDRTWEKHRILPSIDDLALAEEIIAELEGSRESAIEGTIKLENSRLYTEAKSIYEEATRLCAST